MRGRRTIHREPPPRSTTGPSGGGATHVGSGADRLGLRSSWVALLVTAVTRGVLFLFGGLLLWSALPVLAGWESSVVMSGSMEPHLSTGDIVLVRPVEERDLVPGQILLAEDPDHAERLRLHRLVQINPDTGALTLQGDANAQPDSSPVRPEAVRGVASLLIPRVGQPTVWLAEGRHGPLLGGGAALVALIAGSVMFDGGNSTGRHRTSRGRRWSGRARAAASAGVLVLLPGALQGPASAWAAYTSTTSNGVNALASATDYSCAGAGYAFSATRYHKLTEPSGPTATDSSGTGAHGTYQGGVTYGVAGPCLG